MQKAQVDTSDQPTPNTVMSRAQYLCKSDPAPGLAAAETGVWGGLMIQMNREEEDRTEKTRLPDTLFIDEKETREKEKQKG